MHNFSFSHNDIKWKWLWLLCFMLKVMLSVYVELVASILAWLEKNLNFKWHEAKDSSWDAKLCLQDGTSQHICIMYYGSRAFFICSFFMWIAQLSSQCTLECSQVVHNGQLSDNTWPEKVARRAKAFQMLMGFQYTESGCS